MSNMHVICRRVEGSIQMRESKLSKPHHICCIIVENTIIHYVCRIGTSEKFEFNDKLLTFHHTSTTPPEG